MRLDKLEHSEERCPGGVLDLAVAGFRWPPSEDLVVVAEEIGKFGYFSWLRLNTEFHSQRSHGLQQR